jgi:hypothetical protein
VLWILFKKKKSSGDSFYSKKSSVLGLWFTPFSTHHKRTLPKKVSGSFLPKQVLLISNHFNYALSSKRDYFSFFSRLVFDLETQDLPL